MKMDPDESDSSSSDEEMKSKEGEENKNSQPVGFVGTETNDMPYVFRHVPPQVPPPVKIAIYNFQTGRS